MATPLNKKLCYDQQMLFPLLAIKEKSVELLKDLLRNPAFIALSRATGYYTVDLGASDKQSGCVLIKEQADGLTRPIGYWSGTLNDEEKELATTYRKYFAVVWAVV